MERKIKFRAWNEDDKEMYDDVFLSQRIPKGQKGFLKGLGLNEHINDASKSFELMQYTGLKDVNGTEIYEGDIVEYEGFDEKEGSWRDKWVVQFVNELSAYYLMPIKGNTKPDLLHEIGNDVLEVIGNIYENKELLDQPQQ